MVDRIEAESDVEVVVVADHPVQHFCPQYQSWYDAKLPLFVVFGRSAGASEYYDEDFDEHVQWDRLPLNYPHCFLDRPQADCRNVEAVLDRFKPSVVVVYGTKDDISQDAIEWSSTSDSVVGLISDGELRRKENALYRATKMVINRARLKDIDFALTVGDANEEYYRQSGVEAERLLRMHFPIDTELFDAPTKYGGLQCADVYEEYGDVGENCNIVGVVGKLIERKRQGDVIKAAERAQREMLVLIVGSGPEEERLRGLASDVETTVVFTGFVQPKHLPAYYGILDIYVQPASKDAHPLTVSEAIYAGTPVVVSDRIGSYGPTDDVQPGRTGFVYSCGDTERLSQYLDWLIREGAERRVMGKEARKVGLNVQGRAHSGVPKELMRIITAGGMGDGRAL